VIGTPVTGVEAAQVHKAAADKRPSRGHGVTQALRQQLPASGLATARCAYAPGNTTIGQRVWTHAQRGEGRPAADIALCQLDLLRRVGDNCRQ